MPLAALCQRLFLKLSPSLAGAWEKPQDWGQFVGSLWIIHIAVCPAWSSPALRAKDTARAGKSGPPTLANRCSRLGLIHQDGHGLFRFSNLETNGYIKFQCINIMKYVVFSCTLMLNLSNSTLSWERIVHEMARGHILYPAKFAWQKVETAPTPLSGTSRDCFTTSHRTPRVTEDTKIYGQIEKKHLQDFLQVQVPNDN